jgi:nucleoside-diphosphate-sugar epimerase
VERLRQIGCSQIAVPLYKDCDLTREDDIERLFREFHPQLVVHAATLVGGIGANRDSPGRFFYENALMGIQLIEGRRRHGVEKTVVLGTICAYPKFTPVPFRLQLVRPDPAKLNCRASSRCNGQIQRRVRTRKCHPHRFHADAALAVA